MLQTFSALVGNKSADRHLAHTIFHAQFAEAVDELGRVAVVDLVLGYTLMTAVDVDVIVQFKVQVSGKLTVTGADGADTLSAAYQLTKLDANVVQVTVKGLAAEYLAGLGITEGVTHDDVFTPTTLGIFSISHNTVADGVNRGAQIGVTSAITVPVLAEVTRRFQTQTARLVIAFAIRFTNGKIKAVSQGNQGPLTASVFDLLGFDN